MYSNIEYIKTLYWDILKYDDVCICICIHI